jgi:hypothetical protein
MKYYIAEIQETNGEFEYHTKYLFSVARNPIAYAKKTTQEWRSCDDDDWDKSHDAYWCYGTLISDNGFKEIPQEDFDVLKKYLSVL